MFIYYFLQFNINYLPPPLPFCCFPPVVPEVGFEQSSYSVDEGDNLPVTVISNASVPDGVVQVDINNLTAEGQNYNDN